MLKDHIDRWRYAAASPFSKAYLGKKRWLNERDEWEALGIAQSDMRRKVYVVSRTGAVCITVSKCANTTLKFMLHPDIMNDADSVHLNDHLLTRLVDTGRSLNDLLGGADRIFTFSRHPVSRFWSAYFGMVADRPASAIMEEIAAHFGIPTNAELPPETVLEYVKASPPGRINEHIRPQWACTAIERLPINFVGRVETMSDDVQRLLAMGFLDADHVKRFRHLNQSSSMPDIPDKQRIDGIIRDIYAKDMELFGYD